MTRLPRYQLSVSEKDTLLHNQAALIERQAATIEALTERIAALEAELGKPRKTARNSHLPPTRARVLPVASAAMVVRMVRSSTSNEEDRMPGRPITDQQHRYYMTLRKTHPQKTAAAMAGFRSSTGHRAEKDTRLPSERHRVRRHGGGRPDPLADLWDQEIVPLLTNTPGLKPITVLEEMQRRHPKRDLMAVKRR